MKKAKLILTLVALMAVLGGALAFEVGKFTKGPRAYSWTNVTRSTVGGCVYTATGLFCVTPPNVSYINTVNDGLGLIGNTYSTTLPLQVVTLICTPGNQTITRGILGCQLIVQTLITNDF
jgi:hypothetical protein